jgi:inorganic pyrophosphatase
MRLSEIPIGNKAPDEINCVIEISKGSSNKYEYSKALDMVVLDRVLYSPLHYPCDYGFIPQTNYLDGDPLDILVLVSQPTFPGCLVRVRPVGVLMMEDDKGPDEKILSVASNDPRFAETRSLADVGDHLLAELIHFFEVYKHLEWKAVDVLGWKDADVARALITKFRIDK